MPDGSRPAAPAPRRSHRTALSNLSPSGWAEITHPFHPLRGKRFLITKKSRVSGVDTLYLRAETGDGFSVACEWTDQADPSPLTGQTILDVKHLLDLAALVDSLKQAGKEGLDK
jgi:hypothetical protein